MGTEDAILGIDLGTSNSCVAAVVDGQPVVIANEWGENTLASCVSFLPDGRIIVGNEAKRRIVIDPENTVYSAKRLIGRFYYSEEVKKAQAVCPYEIAEGPNNAVMLRVQGQDFSLSEISAMILKEIKTMAENHFGHEVHRAVITVPAYFNDNQRQATKDAGRIAGLDVVRIINEPTAAALSYGFGRNITQKVVVYDLGGGTFDVSILDIGDDIFEVIGTAGDTYLGGDDFDRRILDYLADNFQAKHGIDLRRDKNALQKIREAAERAKRTLSTQNEAKVRVRKVFKDEEGNSYDLNDTVSSVQFATMVQDLMQRTFKVCDELLAAARMTVAEIEGVILVGGPTKLPIIRESVQHYFGKEPLKDIDPDLVVAIGAAIQAESLRSGKQDAVLLDVTPLTLRIGTVHGYTEPIIEKNTPLPIDSSKVFATSRDNQDRVKIRVYQGESKFAEENELLGEFEVSDFRIARRGEVQLEVTFEIDTDGIVNVSAKDLETGKKTTTTINLSSGLSEHDIETSRQRAQQMQHERIREEGVDPDEDLPMSV